MHKPRLITFISGCPTKFKTTVQGFNKESFLPFRLIQKKQTDFVVSENRACSSTRKTGGGQLTTCHWFLWRVGGWKRYPKGPFKFKRQSKLSTIVKVLPVAQGILLFYVVWKQAEASVFLFRVCPLVDSHHRWQQWEWIRYLPVCRQKRKYIFNQEIEITYQVLENRC